MYRNQGVIMCFIEKVRIRGYVWLILFSLLTAGPLSFRVLPAAAQVTTATLYGVIRDPSSAVLPGASVTATNQGTGLTRSVVADERGEFALPALPAGAYTGRVEMPGFKTYNNQRPPLGSGQKVRQTFVPARGQVSRDITH